MDQIRRVRDNKINQGLELVTGPLTAKLNNLCCMELNTLRPFFLGSLDRFLRISKVRVNLRGFQNVQHWGQQQNEHLLAASHSVHLL